MRRNLSTRLALQLIGRGLSIPCRADLLRVGELIDLRDTLSRLQVDLVLDVGANVGQFGCDLRGIGYKSWIVSFEPSPKEFRQLKSLVDQRDAKWVAMEIALSSSEGEAELNITGDSSNNSFFQLHGEASPTVTVQTRRLDSLFDDLMFKTKASRVFLKMDTQGFDLEVFRGAGEQIRKVVGLMSEVSVRPLYPGMPHYIDSLREYEAAGFDLHSLYPVSVTSQGSVIEYNCVMLRSE